MKHRLAGACALLMLCAHTAGAQSLQDALLDTQVHGLLGMYDYTYLNNTHSGKTANDFGVGGNIGLHSGSFEGFSFGAVGYTAQSLGVYDRHTTTDLTGYTHSLQSMREAYLQYDQPWATLRGGRQMLNTPFANQDYFTLNPRAFMGFAGIVDLLGGDRKSADAAPLSLVGDNANLSVFAARMFDRDSRFTNGFDTGNRYLDSSNGLLSFGLQYQRGVAGAAIKLQGWYYNFYALGRIVYGQADVTIPVSDHNSLFAAAQIEDDGDSGSAVSSYGHVDARIYGAKLGLNLGKDSVALVSNYSPPHYNSFRHGGDIHPYNDTSGTIFTDTMQVGIDDIGPGYAIGVTGNILLLNGRLAITPAYVEYKLDYGYAGDVFTFDGDYGYPVGAPVKNQHIHVVDTNFGYSLSDVLKGLSLDWDTDAAIASNGDGQNYRNAFFSSRIFVRYNF